MRLLRPSGFLTKSRVITIAVMLVLVVGAVFLWHWHKNRSVAIINGNDEQIQEHKDSNSPDDRRTILSAYAAKDDYADAAPIARALAKQTKTYQDYLALISICGLHDVPDKDACLDEGVNGAKPLVNSIPFNGAYNAGVILEKNNRKTDAKVFYQRAYDTYTPDPNAENMMTKDQLKAHINEL
jgi:hypothetical protein